MKRDDISKPVRRKSGQLPIPQPIVPDALYPIEALKAASGLGEWAIRQMQRKGLKTFTPGGRRFIRGADFIAFVCREDGDE